MTVPHTRFIRADEAMRRIGVKRTLFEEMVARGDLPRPLKVGNVRVFVEAELETWLTNHIAAERGQPQEAPNV